MPSHSDNGICVFLTWQYISWDYQHIRQITRDQPDFAFIKSVVYSRILSGSWASFWSLDILGEKCILSNWSKLLSYRNVSDNINIHWESLKVDNRDKCCRVGGGWDEVQTARLGFLFLSCPLVQACAWTLYTFWENQSFEILITQNA